MDIEIITDIIQGDEKWDRLRAVTPTASEFSKIITGTGKASTQSEGYMRRLSVNRKYPQPTFKGNQWTDRGHELEPKARERLAKETGYDIRQVGFVRRRDCGAGGSPDGLIYAPGGDQPVAGVEIKCFNVDKHLGILNSGELPTENRPQVHGHLWLSGLPAWLFVLYCPEAFPLDFRIIEVTPDGYTREVGSAVYQFCVDYQKNWQRYLAEYELDQIGKSFEQMCPVTHRLAAPQAVASTPAVTESLI
jgi:hypothetical protein